MFLSVLLNVYAYYGINTCSKYVQCTLQQFRKIIVFFFSVLAHTTCTVAQKRLNP
jgi:hypothetical protein